jgi:hypothetical protein
MTSPTWSAATPGQSMLAGQVNQFLVAHSSTFTYVGSQIITSTPGTAGDELGASGQMAFRFESPSYSASLSWVGLALGAIGAGCDVYLTLQGDTGGAPDSNILASCFIPAEWLTMGLQSTIPTSGFPLNYAMVASTFYNIVLTPVGSLAPGVNDVILTRSTDVGGAYIFDGVGWTAQSYGYAISINSTLQTLTATTQNLVNVYEDNGGLHKRYQYDVNNLVASVKEWAAKAASGPFNILCRDDASFVSTIGTFVGTNCALALSSGVEPVLRSSHSMVLTVTGTPTDAVATTSLFNETNGNQYIPVTYSSIYSAVASVAPAATLRNLRLDIEWYTGGGTPTLISSTLGAVVTETAVNEFTSVYNVNALAPSTAALAKLVVNVIAATGTLASSEVHYVGEAGMFANSNTVWSMPGAGISSSKYLSYNAANDPIYVY